MDISPPPVSPPNGQLLSAAGARPLALSGYGRPASALGTDGSMYLRTDTHWTYTKKAGEWTVSSVSTAAGSTVYPFAARPALYVSPYLANAPGGNIYGNLMTHAKGVESTQRLSLIDASPSIAYGVDGSANFSSVASPTNAAKKAHLFRTQKNDRPVGGGADVRRTMVRFGDTQTGTHDGGGLNLVNGEWRAFAFSVYLPALFKSTLFNLQGWSSNPLLTEAGGVLLWQLHDTVGGDYTPQMSLSAMASWNKGNPNRQAAPDGDMGGGPAPLANGQPPRLVWMTNGGPGGWTLNDYLATGRGTLVQADFATDTWLHFCGRFKLHYNVSSGPRTEVWMAQGSGMAAKVVDSSYRNSFDTPRNPFAPSYGIYGYTNTASWAGGATEVSAYYGDYFMSTASFRPSDQDCLDAIAVLQARHQ